MPIHWPRFVELVRSHERFLLTSHIRPDCDALGSELGMAGVLEALGKEVPIVNAQKTPPNLQFIDPDAAAQDAGRRRPAARSGRRRSADGARHQRLGPVGHRWPTWSAPRKAHKLILDHHVGEDDLGAELFKNPQAEATGRLVLEAAHHLGVQHHAAKSPRRCSPPSPPTPAGFASARPPAPRCDMRGELVDAGAVPSEIYTALYEQDTLARLQLRGRILARTEDRARRPAGPHGGAARKTFEATGALPSDTEDVINMTLGVAGTQVAVILVEQPTGGFKLSFRSRTPSVDCNRAGQAVWRRRTQGGRRRIHQRAAGRGAEPRCLTPCAAPCDNCADRGRRSVAPQRPSATCRTVPRRRLPTLFAPAGRFR